MGASLGPDNALAHHYSILALRLLTLLGSLLLQRLLQVLRPAGVELGRQQPIWALISVVAPPVQPYISPISTIDKSTNLFFDHVDSLPVHCTA